MVLPESILDGLKQIHDDRGRAIVSLVDSALRKPSPRPAVEVVELADKTGLIVVGPSDVLRRIPFLHMLNIAPDRFLLALDHGYDYGRLELALRDLLEELRPEEDKERQLIVRLSEQITYLRKSFRVRMAEVVFVDLPQEL